MQNYKLISRKGEGTFSEVLKAQSIKTGKYVAIKCMKTHFESIEQVNQLREIQALRKVAPHPHIIKLLEVLFDEPTGRLALVFELMDMNLYELIKDRKTYLPQSRVKHYMYQLFKAVDHIHRKGVFHRDIKPENILISGELIKLADIGSCRGMFGEHPYTEYISTRWYRSPECLMTDGYYDHMMDIWGAGCVMFEILTLDPLFPGKNELDMIHKIHNLLGTPPQEVLDRFKSHASHLDFNFPVKVGTGLEKLIPHVSPDCLDLLKQLLTYDPEKRMTAGQALKHEYFRELAFAEQQKEFQSTLTSARLSPEFKQFQQSLYIDPEKLTTFHNENHTTKHKDAKKKYKKFPNVKSTSKFPNLKSQFKVEDSLKISHLHDASTEEEDNSKELHLSKLPVINLGAKFAGSPVNTHIKKKDDWSKHSHGVLKTNLSNPQLKKLQKPHILADAPDYLVVGKKAP